MFSPLRHSSSSSSSFSLSFSFFSSSSSPLACHLSHLKLQSCSFSFLSFFYSLFSSFPSLAPPISHPSRLPSLPGSSHPHLFPPFHPPSLTRQASIPLSPSGTTSPSLPPPSLCSAGKAGNLLSLAERRLVRGAVCLCWRCLPRCAPCVAFIRPSPTHQHKSNLEKTPAS